MEHFTIILLGLICLLSLWNAIIWTNKGFFNIVLKVYFIATTILGINVLLGAEALHHDRTSVISIVTFMWCMSIALGVLGFTWRSTGGLNLFMKFIHMTLAIGCAVWLMI
jgi:hypothetical protein